MKVIAKPIDMVAWFDRDGLPHPVKFKIEKEKSEDVKKIDRILNREKQKLAGNEVIVYTCQSIFNNDLKIYEIKYELNYCRWILFKI
ncbi:hypothetical protein [Clostridium sp. DL1XJH146]